MIRNRWAVAAALLTMPYAAEAQQPLELRRLSAAIRLDGVPDEEAWQRIEPLPLTQYAPVFRGTPRQRSEIRVAYDDENLYAAGWFYDEDPGGIRINSLYRDRWNGDDAFAIYVDAFNDNRNAKWFGTTPGGRRRLRDCARRARAARVRGSRARLRAQAVRPTTVPCRGAACGPPS